MVCLNTVTAKFPVYPLGVVGRDINEHCVKLKGKSACSHLPKLPKNVRGQTDIMIGIKYIKYFPKEAYRLQWSDTL